MIAAYNTTLQKSGFSAKLSYKILINDMGF
jgi:hypothetical protein